MFQDDYRRSVNEYDEKVFLSFKLMLRELRNIYVSNINCEIAKHAGLDTNITATQVTFDLARETAARKITH